MSKFVIFLLSLLLLTTIAIGCSGSGIDDRTQNPIQPELNGIPLGETVTENMSMLGIWTFEFDTENLSAKVEPIRDTMLHYNITQWLPAPSLNVNSFDPGTRIMDVDVLITNPYDFGGYDVRGILYTNNNGLTLVNADDWTAFFDIPGGKLFNPFKAYAKTQTNRLFSGHTSFTEKYLVYLPNPSGPIQYAITASFPGNCQEPYSIDGFQHESLNEDSGKIAHAEVRVMDWQMNTSAVYLNASPITGIPWKPFYFMGSDMWGIEIKNSAGAPPGDYSALIVTASSDSGTNYLLDYVTITIESGGIPDNMQNITPEYLNFSPIDMAVDGDYAYVATQHNGLHIFDISDLTDPKWVKRVLSATYVRALDVSGGYAYVVGSNLQIIDITTPQEAHVVKLVSLGLGWSEDIKVFNGYAYAAAGNEGFFIVDVDPVPDAYVVTNYDTAGKFKGVDIDGTTLFIADYNNGLQIFSVADVGSPTLLGSISMNQAESVDVFNGIAYVTNGDLNIVDVDPPETPSILMTVNTESWAQHVAYNGGYAYIADSTRGLTVVDVEPPGSAYVVDNYDLPGYAEGVFNRAYETFVACVSGGFAIFDVYDPANVQLLSNPSTPGDIEDVEYSDGYAFLANGNAGLGIVDVDPPNSANMTLILDKNGEANRIVIQNDLAYMAYGNIGLQICDISVPENSTFEGWVYTSYALGVAVNGNYAYASNASADVKIIDISNPMSPSIINTIPVTGTPYGISYKDGYIYVASHSGGLNVIDVDPPMAASVVHTVTISGYAWDVAVQGNYAYVASNGLSIVDITTPETASITNYLYLGSQCYGLDVQDGYAYIANYGAGLKTVDIDPPSSAFVVSTLACPRGAFNVDAAGSRAYVACKEGGLLIANLW